MLGYGTSTLDGKTWSACIVELMGIMFGRLTRDGRVYICKARKLNTKVTDYAEHTQSEPATYTDGKRLVDGLTGNRIWR